MDASDNLLEEGCIEVDELRIGLTRQAMIKGVPIIAFLSGMGGVACIFTAIGNPLYLLLAFPVYGILRLISAANPRIFDEIAAWVRVHAHCNNRSYWGGASFSPRRTQQWEKR